MAEQFDLVIIGSGNAGYIPAIRASQLGMSVAMIEKEENLGGTCLNWGCIPTKALLQTAAMLNEVKHAEEFGVKVGDVEFDPEQSAKRRDQVVNQLRKGVSGLMKKNKVQVFTGVGSFVEPKKIKVEGEDGEQELEAGNVLIASGSAVNSLPGIEFDDDKVISSDDVVMGKGDYPESIIILGSGAVGVEFASMYNDFGTEVTIVEILDRIVPGEDPEISEQLKKEFEDRGIHILTSTKADIESLEKTDDVVDPVRVGPGVPWVQLEDHLKEWGMGLKVYPTSAPRSTVGGWLALDGMGVGSYEFGWLGENVVCMEVVEPDGNRRQLPGDELSSVRESTYGRPLIVGALLSTRSSARDVPFGVAFDDPARLARAIQRIFERIPLWHLGLLNGVMARAMGHHEEGHVLFGAYPAERTQRVEDALWEAVALHSGKRLPAAQTHRIWGSRFYPSDPAAGRVPHPGAALVPQDRLGPVLRQLRDRFGASIAFEGSVSRTGELLLLAFGHDPQGVSELGRKRHRELLEIAGEHGGRPYRVESGGEIMRGNV